MFQRNSIGASVAVNKYLMRLIWGLQVETVLFYLEQPERYNTKKVILVRRTLGRGWGFWALSGHVPAQLCPYFPINPFLWSLILQFHHLYLALVVHWRVLWRAMIPPLPSTGGRNQGQWTWSSVSPLHNMCSITVPLNHFKNLLFVLLFYNAEYCLLFFLLAWC